MRADELRPYFDHLSELPFVAGLRVVPTPNRQPPAVEFKTPHGKYRMGLLVLKTHLTRELAERLIATTPRPTLVLGPAIGRELGNMLTGAQLYFVDLAGNCYLDLDGQHVARIQGQRAAPKATAQKAMRAPAYRALFALLAKPELARVPVRTLAEAAAVSRQAAIDIRARLVEMDILYKRGAAFGWTDNAEQALDLFVTGYATTLRPKLLIGRYRTPDADPGAAEKRIGPLLGRLCDYRWGGGAAADRLLHYYHGPNTVVHLDNPPTGLPKTLKAVADRHGPLQLLGLPGPLALEGAGHQTAHPLLVYAELLVEGGERAREAAQQVLERYLPQERYR